MLLLTQLLPRIDQRAAFFGKTGSGKTTLAKRLLETSDTDYVILDAKHTVTIPGVKIVKSWNKRLDRQIVRPPNPATEMYEYYKSIMGAWQRKNIIIYVDELTLVNPNAVRLSNVLARAIRTGRERKVGVWIGSQRPKQIPSSVFTETDHIYAFRLSYKADRDKVGEFTSDKTRLQLDSVKGHDFVYYRVDDEVSVRVKQ